MNLHERIIGSTVMYRKGEMIEVHGDAIHVYMMDESPRRGWLVDMHFVDIGFTELVADREGFVDALRAALGQGEFCSMDEDRFKRGPSYIEVGSWLGSQDLALSFMALCKFHGVADVLTPARMELQGDLADEAAGMGLMFLTGFDLDADADRFKTQITAGTGE